MKINFDDLTKINKTNNRKKIKRMKIKCKPMGGVDPNFGGIIGSILAHGMQAHIDFLARVHMR